METASFWRFIETCIIIYALVCLWQEYKLYTSQYQKQRKTKCESASSVIIEAQKLLYRKLSSYGFGQLAINPLEHFYTRLCVVTVLEDGSQEKQNEEDVQNLFIPDNDNKQQQHVNRILIESEPGCGKTLLAIKLAYDWACQRDYLHSRYDFVMVMQCRQLNRCNDVDDVLLHLFADESITCCSSTEKLDFLAKRQKRCLLILDGMEDLNERGSQMLQLFLGDDNYPEMSIVVTSRKKSSVCCQSGKTLTKVRRWTKRVTIEPLSSDEDKYNFLVRYFGRNDVERHITSVKKRISNSIYFALDYPMNLMLTVTMATMSEFKEHIVTLTEFYKSGLKLLIRMSHHQQNDIDAIFVQLGKSALEDMLSAFQSSDSRADFESTSRVNELLNDSLFGGQLATTSKLCLVPKTFVEFFATFYIASLQRGKTEQNEFGDKVGNLLKHGITPTTHPFVYRFLTGHLGDQAHRLFALLFQWNDNYQVFDTEIINMMHESEPLPTLLEALKPFIPVTWKIGSYPEFAITPWHRTLIDYGTTQGHIKTVDWNLEFRANVPDYFRVENLIFSVWKSDVRRGLETLKHIKVIKCNLLLCSLNYFNEEIWEAFLHLSSRIGTRKIVIDINGNDDIAIMRDIVKKMQNELSTGKWDEFTIQQLQVLDVDLETDRLPSSLITNLVKTDKIDKELGKKILQCNNNNDDNNNNNIESNYEDDEKDEENEENEASSKPIISLTREEKAALDKAIQESDNVKASLFMKYIQSSIPEFQVSSSAGEERGLWKYVHLDASIKLPLNGQKTRTVIIEMMGTGKWRQESDIDLLRPFGNITLLECNSALLDHVIDSFPADWLGYSTLSGLKLSLTGDDPKTGVFRFMRHFTRLSVFVLDLSPVNNLHFGAVDEILQSLEWLQKRPEGDKLKILHVREIATCHLPDVQCLAEGIAKLHVQSLDDNKSTCDWSQNKSTKKRRRTQMEEPTNYYLEEFKVKFATHRRVQGDSLRRLLEAFRQLLCGRVVKKLSVVCPTRALVQIVTDKFNVNADFWTDMLSEEPHFSQNYLSPISCENVTETKLTIMYNSWN